MIDGGTGETHPFHVFLAYNSLGKLQASEPEVLHIRAGRAWHADTGTLLARMEVKLSRTCENRMKKLRYLKLATRERERGASHHGYR